MSVSDEWADDVLDDLLINVESIQSLLAQGIMHDRKALRAAMDRLQAQLARFASLNLAPAAEAAVTLKNAAPKSPPPRSAWDRILELSQNAPDHLPPDYAERHDDYKRKRLGRE